MQKVLLPLLLLLLALTFSARHAPVAEAKFQCPVTDCAVECTSQTEDECDYDEILVADPSVCGCCRTCVGGSGT